MGGGVRYWLNIIILAALMALLLCLLGSCRSHRGVAYTSTDSVRVELRETVLHDTVEITLPLQTAERETPDTFSRLETDYAVSEARVSEGRLRHTLRTKRQALKAAVERTVVTRDSIVYRDRVAETRARTKTPWWRKAWRVSPIVLFLLLALVWRLYRKTLKRLA
ncbi:MAG: hypothetical protein LUC33_06735 [Prevotellaceae bacterium]|nr:hypothetical protein [Prevotellaceae bacterium]